jgi:hypothetical protein
MMRGQVRVIELAPARLVFEQAPGFATNIVDDLRKILREVTGDLWEVEQRSEGGAPTLMEVDAKARDAQVAQRLNRPDAGGMAAFPGRRTLPMKDNLAVFSAASPWEPIDEVDGRDDQGRPAGRRNDPEADERNPVQARSLEVEGSAGGGLVKIRASAKGRVIGVSVDDSLLAPAEKGILED